MKIAFIGLGNVGGKLAGSLLRNGFELAAHDLNDGLVREFERRGATRFASLAESAGWCDAAITCLPSPEASASVLEGEGGLLRAMRAGGIWCEMSTTDEQEVKRLGAEAERLGIDAVDCPVSGGCHRAATGNISIFAGCRRDVFDAILPVLSSMGRRILHTGGLGTASALKVATNYLATANLVSLCEVLTAAKLASLDLATTYEAIRISSGNSFVHETESQVILNGSRHINFMMDLVLKDLKLLQGLPDRAGLRLELSQTLIDAFEDAAERYGTREWSPNVIRRLEEACGATVRASGFPAEIVDDEPEALGYEVRPRS